MGPSEERPDGFPPRGGSPRASEQELWSWVDRGDARLGPYLEAHPEERQRVSRLRALIAGVCSHEAPAQPEHVGPYRIIARIGQGAMGVVYEVVQPALKRRVALKVLRAEPASEPGTAFEREVAALARLSHPGIAAIHEAAREPDGPAYLVMELVEGLPLVAHAREHGLDRRARIALLRAVCLAVQHAHARGVVHRDLKPSNVLVSASGEPKVLDFGLARLVDTVGSTQAGAVLGTPAYMSPEQARGEQAGPESDVYALGVMLYELLTGALPIEVAGLSVLEAAQRIAHAQPRRPSRLVAALGPELEAVLLRCLEKDPARRYADAGALADELGRWLAGEWVLARPPALARRVLGRLRRHRVAAVVGTLMLALAASAAFAVLFPTELPWKLTADWLRVGSPFEELRWRGDAPEVALAGRWYELESIEGLDVAYVVGFCRQYAGSLWRKRFSEDLVQVLNRMRAWALFTVDFVLRDPESGARVQCRGVRLDQDRRNDILSDRHTWPFEILDSSSDGLYVLYRGQVWRLVSLEGVPAESFHGGDLYDTVCARAGHSPGVRIDFALERPDAALTLFRGVPRDGSSVPEEAYED